MVEGSTGQELAPIKSPEKINPTKAVFEHLFPGNKFERLPRIKLLTPVHLWFQLLATQESREATFGGLHKDYNKSFAVRHSIWSLDQTALRYQLLELKPVEAQTGQTWVNGHTFADLVDTEKGEKIGGVAERDCPVYGTLLKGFHRKLAQLGGHTYTETVIGILDKDGRPAGIILFVEGRDKRVSRRKEERVPLGTGVTVPQMQPGRIPVRY